MGTQLPVNQTRSPARIRSGRNGPTSYAHTRPRDDPIQKPFLVTAATTVAPEAVAVRPVSDLSDRPASASRKVRPSTDKLLITAAEAGAGAAALVAGTGG